MERENIDTSSNTVALFWIDTSNTNSTFVTGMSKIISLFGQKNCYLYSSPNRTFEHRFHDVSHPIVLLCSGLQFENLPEKIIRSRKIMSIVIFCFNPKKYDYLSKAFRKVRLVSNSPRNIISEVKSAKEYVHILRSRFFDESPEKTFIPASEKDQEEILKGTVIKGNLHQDESNILYPLYFGSNAINKEELFQTVLNLELLSFQQKSEENHHLFICQVQKLQELVNIEDPDPRVFIETYTDDGLYRQFNLDFRKATEKSLSYWRYYGYCLRGAMCMLGSFVKGDKKVFRGLSLPPSKIKEWIGNKGRIVLLPSYTSTTLNKNEAKEFMKMEEQEGKKTCIMKIKFVKNEKEYKTALSVFDKALWSGIYYPVDIHNFSAKKNEEEVLFPPFYPVKIIDIIQGDNEVKIKLETPIQLNLGNYRERPWWQAKLKCNQNQMLMNYLDKVLELAQNDLLDTINFGIEL